MKMTERAHTKGRCSYVLLVAAILWIPTQSQTATTIKTDASWGRTPGTLSPTASNTTVTGNRGAYLIPGNVYTIAEAQGRLAGRNLFHSFDSFNIGAGDAAVFTTTTSSLNNVISRVSGTSPTTVNGLLALNPAAGSAPNFFFINPNGVTFAAGAQVDVPASFHVSTASSLNFSDQILFRAGSGPDSTLTIGAPEAFGFLGNRPVASVNLNNLDPNGNAARSRLSIGLAPGSRLDIVGGAVQLSSVDVSVPAGALLVRAAGNATAEVPVNGAGSRPLVGSIEASDATLSATGVGAIALSGGSIILRDGTVISGNAGSVGVTSDALFLSGGAKITTEGINQGKAGSITINTNHLSMLSGSQIVSSSLSTQQNSGSASIAIQGQQGDGSFAQSLLLSGNATSISTATDGASQGGNIQIAARQMNVEKLATINAETSAKGDAGNITLVGDSLAVITGARIEASTAGEGQGGSIAVTTTGDVTVSGVSVDRQTRSGLFAKTQTPTNGTGGGGPGNGGGGPGGGGGGGTAAKPGNAGDITILAKNLVLDSGAQIDSSTTSGASGGSVAIKTAENITITGSDTRLTSDATRGGGQGGSITLVAKNISVREHASVTAATGGKGDAGNITLTALDQLLMASAGTVTTSTSGSGKGGTIVIQASQVMLDGSGTAIIADTLRPFADLTITINILHANDGDLVVQLDSPSETRVALLSRIGETGENFTDTRLNDQSKTPITAGSAPFTGTFKPREPLAQLINELATGNWTLNVRDQTSGNVGSLQSWTLQIGQQTFQSTGGPKTIPDVGSLRSTIVVANPILPTVQGIGEATGIGGDVTVNAGTVTVQNGAIMSAITRGSGKGGIVTVNATGLVALSGGVGGKARIATDTFGKGGAGDILINAQSLLLSSSELSSNSSGSASGNAGNIDINLGATLTLLAGGAVSSSTQSLQGAAGSIKADASQVVVDGAGSAILADALAHSSGQTGSLTVNAASAVTLSEGGILSIRNDATVARPDLLNPTLLAVSAPNVTLQNAKITAESTGNVDASDIRIRFAGRLIVDPSSITTSANQGNGGAISIGGGQNILLQDSQITTSVRGGVGNGGDISIQAGSLVMQSGFIQANTAGVGASGGNVVIDVQTLLPSGNSVFVGGSTPFVFQSGVSGPNVIQAAAPTGVSGAINSTAPTLDVAGSLSRLSAEVVDFGAFGKDPCRTGARSSFTRIGRGGLRSTSTGMIRPEDTLRRMSQDSADQNAFLSTTVEQRNERLSALSDCR